MKKIITVFLVIATFFTSCGFKKNDLEKSNLKCKIWKLEETKFEGKDKLGKYQIGNKKEYGHRFVMFNREGNIIENKLLYGKEEEILALEEYSYDNDGNCKEIVTYEENEVVQKQVNKIDNDKITEAQIFDKNGRPGNKYQYNFSGEDISGGKILTSDDKIIKTFKSEYINGLLVKHVEMDSNKEITKIETYKRNEKGDIIYQKVEYPKETVEYVNSFEFDYDEKGNWLKQYQIDKAGKIEEIIVRNIVYYDE